MAEFKWTVTNPSGLDARLAGALVKEAAKCSGRVSIRKGEKAGDAMSIFNIMALGIKYNEEVEITVEGGDDEAEVAMLETFAKENM